MLTRRLGILTLGLFVALSTPACAGAHDFLMKNETSVVKSAETLQKAAKALALLDQLAGDSVDMAGTPAQLDALGSAILAIQDAEKSLHKAAEELRSYKVLESLSYLDKAIGHMAMACTALEAVGVNTAEVRGLLEDLDIELDRLRR